MDKKQTTKKHHSKDPKNEKLTKVKKQWTLLLQKRFEAVYVIFY